MSLFQDLLTQLAKRLGSDAASTSEAAVVISHIVGVTVPPESIIARRGVIYLSVAPTLKMAILAKKGAILEAFRGKKLPFHSIA